MNDTIYFDMYLPTNGLFNHVQSEIKVKKEQKKTKKQQPWVNKVITKKK